MKIKKLNLQPAKDFELDGILVFVKPLGAKLHRVWRIPVEGLTVEQVEELKLVLNTLCTRKHNNVWYFDLRDQDACNDIMDTFINMGLNPVHIKLDADPHYSN